ncbi:MAG TPA: hypothetical protein VM364_02080 [Vicinamibacterales bacterium]|nr:hypothetical protein [Vicinamibacterales bacterium]
MALAGLAAAIYYARLGLSLAHYDARAHLVVARRILDSLTPGWQQIGAVWLPLPHVLNMLPVQVDAWYRTGASAIAISILSMALAAGSLASLLVRLTGSIVAAAAGAVLLMANPNVLYLQGTAMTEPLLFGLSLFSVAAVAAWLDAQAGSEDRLRRWAGAGLAAACLTRYEAWAITATLLGLALLVRLRRGAGVASAARDVLRLALWPVIAIVVFSINSKWTVGEWVVSGGFFVPENVEALGNPMAAARQVHEGLLRLAGTWLPRAGYAGAAILIWTFVRHSTRASLVLLIALAAAAALPIAAYTQGHPFRIRYDLPLVVASAALAAAGIALLPRLARLPAALVVIAASVLQAPPLDREAPLLRESQREARHMAARKATITAYLEQHYDGSGIMMSMGSLAHYMHDLSHAGFSIKDFLHEGNGEIWPHVMLRPRGHAGFLIIEGSAEGGDALHHASLRDRWLEGFELVAEGGGARLYRAVDSR